MVSGGRKKFYIIATDNEVALNFHKHFWKIHSGNFTTFFYTIHKTRYTLKDTEIKNIDVIVHIFFKLLYFQYMGKHFLAISTFYFVTPILKRMLFHSYKFNQICFGMTAFLTNYLTTLSLDEFLKHTII